MGKLRKRLKKTIAILTLVATVLETGFSSVTVFASEIKSIDAAEVDIDIPDEVVTNDASTDDASDGDAYTVTSEDPDKEDADDVDTSSDADDSDDADVLVETKNQDEDTVEATTVESDDETADGSKQANKESGLTITDSGITGTGLDSASVYIDTTKLAKKDTFNVKFTGPDSASYNPVLNDQLDKTNSGLYDFDGLDGSDFSVRASSKDDVILSYDYNEDGYATIFVESKPADKILDTKVLTAVDNSKISAISGEGYESITVNFDTEDLSDKDVFKFYVESEASATVDGKSAISGIGGLTKDDTSLTVEGLDNEEFVAYVISDGENSIESVAQVVSVEDGIAEIDINNVATNRIYEYEDEKVYVRATLEKADAIPDDAYFAVTPLSEEEAQKYLDFLNSNRDEETAEYTESNSLLYDIAFYTDESMSEEIEPEEGSVSLSVEFKQSQVSEDLGVENKEDIEVTHITVEGSNLEAETLPVSQNGSLNTVEVVTDSFSVFVFKGNGSKQLNVKDPGSENGEDILGPAWTYGITADTWEFDGESETSFAVNKLVNKNGGGGQTGANKTRTPDSDFQYCMVGDVETTSPIMIKGFSCMLAAPKEIQSQFSNATDWVNGKQGVLLFDTTDASVISGKISTLLDRASLESARLASNDSVIAEISEKDGTYKGLPSGDSAGHLEIDITGAETGTYYINVDKYPALLNAFKVSSGVKIIKKSGQKLVFNFTKNANENDETDPSDGQKYTYTINKYILVQDGSTYDSTNISEKSYANNPIAEDIIFNFSGSANIKAADSSGIYIAPKSTFKFAGVCGGWLICNKAISKAEWHFLNTNIGEPEPSSVSFKVPVNKKFIGGSGKWKNGFTFKLEKLSPDGKSVDNTWEAQEITLKEGDDDTATGYFEFSYDDTKGDIHWDDNDDRSYSIYEKVITEWYRVSEIQDRSDVDYDLLGNPGLGYTSVWDPQQNKYVYKDSKGNVIDAKYWYIHVFIYKDDKDDSWPFANKQYAQYEAVWRTARCNPDGYNWNNGLPCKVKDPLWFYNKYNEPVKVTIDGEKKINDSTQNVPSGKFTFTLQNYLKNNLWADVTDKYTVTNDGSHFTFPEIELDLDKPTASKPVGFNTEYYYYFKIDETNDCAPYGPDPAQFIAKVTVTKSMDGSISTRTQYYRFKDPSTLDCKNYPQINTTDKNKGISIEPLYFNNTYDASGEYVVHVTKTLEGRDLKDDDVFTFILESTDDKKNPKQKKTIKVGDLRAKGQNITSSFKFDFEKLSFDLKNDAGNTYTYTVTEQTGNDKNMVYSSVSYEIKLTITDDKNGHLIVDDNNAPASCDFINTHFGPEEIPFKVKKTWPKGTDEVFTFKLEGGKTSGTGANTDAYKVNQTVTITGTGEKAFDSVNYADMDSVGTYEYTIHEDVPLEAVDYKQGDSTYKIYKGIIYDNRTYYINVDVAYDTTGKKLVKTVTAGFDKSALGSVTVIEPEFVNEYEVKPVKDHIEGEKEFINGNIVPGQFTFALEAFDDTTKNAIKDKNVEMPAKLTVQNGIPETSLKADKFRFDDITFNTPGTYKFKVTEVQGTRTDIIYSKEDYVVTFDVTDEDGQLVTEQTAEYNDGSGSYVTVKGITYKFINTEVIPGQVPLYAFKKVLVDVNGQQTAIVPEPGAFYFSLYKVEGSTQKLLQGKVPNNDKGYANFKPLTYGYEDLQNAAKKVFNYVIKEDVPAEAVQDPVTKVWKYNGYTYDGHEDQVEVTISLEDGKIKAETGVNYTGSVFENPYDVYGKTPLEVGKELTGRKYEDGDEYKWSARLENINDSNDPNNQTASLTLTKVLGAITGGKFIFKELEYNKTGEFIYSLTEVENIPEENLIVDGNTYYVKVTASDVKKNGELTVAYDIFTDKACTNKVEKAKFVNKKVLPDSVDIEALKEVNGTTLVKDMFSFQLYDADRKPLGKAVKNDAAGKVAFPSISYELKDVGKHTYYITEDTSKPMSGWTYDTSEFKVEVEVTTEEKDNVKSVKAGKPQYYKKEANGSYTKVDAAAVKFINTYECAGEVDLKAYKKLTDRAVSENQFKFQLLDENYNVIEEIGNKAAKKGENAEVIFKTLKFEEGVPGDKTKGHIFEDKLTHKDDGMDKYYRIYYVKEVIPTGAQQAGNVYKLNGYTYDATVYRIVVSLEDKKDGKIYTDWTAVNTSQKLDDPTWIATLVKWINKTVGTTVFKDETKQPLFINSYNPVGAIQINAKKLLEGKDIKDYKFTFRLTGKDENGKIEQTVNNDVNGNITFKPFKYTHEGEYEYTVEELIPPEAKKIDNDYYMYKGVYYTTLKHTVKVKVEEKDTTSGKLVVTATIDGAPNPVTEVTVTEENGVETTSLKPENIKFVNKYKPEGTELTPGGTKTLTGRDLKPEEFHFTLSSNSTNPKSISETVSNTDDNFTFSKIEFTPEDMFDQNTKTYLTEKKFGYTISEVIEKTPGVTFDSKVYEFEVTVKDVDGKLVKEITQGDAVITDPTGLAHFNNIYKAEGELPLYVLKTVNTAGDKDKKFLFKLYDEQEKKYTHEIECSANDGIKQIASYKYTLADLDGKTEKDFKYTVEEYKPDETNGWTYFTDAYTATVHVKDNGNGKLEATDSYTLAGEPYGQSGSAMEFKNEYHAKGTTRLVGKKEFPGGQFEGDDFTFVLEQAVVKNGKTEYEEVTTTTNDINGNFYFDLPQFTETDNNKVFVYRVREDKERSKAKTNTQIKFDNRVYDVKVSVKDLKNGKLNVSQSVTQGDQQIKDCVFRFVNPVTTPSSVRFHGIKTLKGLPLKDQMFKFTLTGGASKNRKGESQGVYNKGTEFYFNDINYTLDDVDQTFTYTIAESSENPITGVTYDKTQYTAIVDVKLVDNKVVAESRILKDGVKTDTIAFENTFEAKVNVPLGGSKVLRDFPKNAPSLGKYDYTFMLYNEEGVNIDSAVVTPKSSDKPVAYKFKDLVFDQNDYLNSADKNHTFKYQVLEFIPKIEDKAPNVIYDTNKYNITVKLSYKDNKLVAETSTDRGVKVTELDFTNRYEAAGSLTLDGYKTIEGKELENAAYTFELADEKGTIQTKTNDGDRFFFDTINYTANDLGTHTYTVTESAKTKDGSTADTTLYIVKVNVSEGSNGQLIVDKDLYRQSNGEEPAQIGDNDPIVFHNTYKAKGDITLSGVKVMHNRPLAGGEFSFLLKEEGNPEPIQTVTNGAASLNNKKDLEARAAFTFDALSFTQEDLLAANGKTYLPEVTKYYTIEEVISDRGGVTYSNAAYAVAINIKDKGNGELEVTTNVAGNSEVKKNGGSVADFLKGLIGKITGKHDEIIFYNDYDSECTIDPPILKKQIMGRYIDRGEFQFKIEGPGLRSMNETKYERIVKNGINPETGSIYDKNNNEIDAGEIYVSDITYKYMDLVDDESFSLETGAVSANFVYYATEIDTKEPGVQYTDQKFKLQVNVIENGDGTMSVKNANGEIVDGVNTKLFWEPVNPYAYNDEQMNDIFLNTFPWKGQLDIIGVKKMEGRELTKDDVFEFTITDEETGKSTTVNNTVDKNGKPSIVAFNAADIDFLNYKETLVEEEESKLRWIDESGEHKYLIEEKPVSANGITGDTSKFEVTVNVSPKYENGKPVMKDGCGVLETEITKVEQIYSQNNKVEYVFNSNNDFEFVNKFKAKGTESIDGIKFLKDQNGESAALADESIEGKFNFTLYSYDSEARSTGKRVEDTATTDKNGKFTLNLPVFDQEVLKNEKGEYETSKTLYYRIIETKPSEGMWKDNNTVFESNGVIYDNTEYDVDVTVTSDGSGNLKVEKTIVNAITAESVDTAIYTNIKNNETVTISGKKTWVDDVDDDKEPDVKLELYSSAVDNGKTVINEYTIKAPAKTYTFTTDKKGQELPAYDSKGKEIKYTVKELPIAGYVSEQSGYDFTNTKGHIVIQKLDDATKAPLAGATLAIYDGKTEVEKWTTESSAHVVKAVLTPGKTYTLKEITAPAGYEVAADMTFTVPADGSDITVTMTDKPIVGTVRLTKLDSATRKTLEGAEFSLYTSTGTRIFATGSAGSYTVTSATSNGVFAVNSSGILEITNLPHGSYYFVETKAPSGYALSSERLSFTIAKAGELVEVTFLNKQSVGSVRLRKVSSAGSRSLAGAVFELYAATPRTAGQAVSSTIYPDAYYRYGTYTTNSSGEIYVGDLPWDDYYFIEVQAPDGYTIDRDISGEPLVYTFSVNAATSGSTIDLGDIINEPVEEEAGVLGARAENGVLGVRSTPKQGVKGARVVPVTADASAVALWLTLLVACVGTIVWLLKSKKKKNA